MGREAAGAIFERLKLEPARAPCLLEQFKMKVQLQRRKDAWEGVEVFPAFHVGPRSRNTPYLSAIIGWLYNLQRQLAYGPARRAQVADDAYDQIVLLELVAAIVHGEIPFDRKSRTKTKESSGLLVDDDALASD